jgi:hypothetical protein
VIDVEALLVGLFAAEYPDADVAAVVDTESVKRVPLILFRSINGTLINKNGLGEEWTVDIRVIGEGRDATRVLAVSVHSDLYAMIGHPAGQLAGIGAIAGVDTISLPTHATSATLGVKHLFQFDSAYTVRVRPVPAP